MDWGNNRSLFLIQALQYIKLPVFGTFNIPAAVNASASAKIIPSHPFAAMISIVTGRYSSFNVMVELYAAWPTILCQSLLLTSTSTSTSTSTFTSLLDPGV
jgi:hypothetical protein